MKKEAAFQEDLSKEEAEKKRVVRISRPGIDVELSEVEPEEAGPSTSRR